MLKTYQRETNLFEFSGDTNCNAFVPKVFASPIRLSLQTKLHVALQGHRGSHRRCSIIKAVLKTLATFTGKHLYWSHFFKKVAASNTSVFL